MSELGEMYRDWNEIKRDKKRSNLDWSTNFLVEQGINFESKNGGIHLIVYGKNENYDFYPSTGKFIARSDKKHGRGVRNLVKRLKAEGF